VRVDPRRLAATGITREADWGLRADRIETGQRQNRNAGGLSVTRSHVIAILAAFVRSVVVRVIVPVRAAVHEAIPRAITVGRIRHVPHGVELSSTILTLFQGLILPIVHERSM
jgi:hypothetical protein